MQPTVGHEERFMLKTADKHDARQTSKVPRLLMKVEQSYSVTVSFFVC